MTLSRPALTPAETADVLSHLAAAVAALPQASAQLAEILDQAKSDQVLETDDMSDTNDPTLAVDTARLHLEEAREAAVVLYRLLDAAHQQAAHLISHTTLTTPGCPPPARPTATVNANAGDASWSAPSELPRYRAGARPAARRRAAR